MDEEESRDRGGGREGWWGCHQYTFVYTYEVRFVGGVKGEVGSPCIRVIVVPVVNILLGFLLRKRERPSLESLSLSFRGPLMRRTGDTGVLPVLFLEI